MKTKDYLLVTLAPLPLLLIPLIGVLTSPGWRWTLFDFVAAWVVLASATFVFRLIVTRPVANLAYKAGAGLAVAAALLIAWISAAVQIIGDENPGNGLYLGVILIGLIGVGRARFSPAGMARAAFATAGATFLVPIVAVLAWPGDFSPGVPQVFALNFGFVLLFTAAGCLFRRAASDTRSSQPQVSL